MSQISIPQHFKTQGNGRFLLVACRGRGSRFRNSIKVNHNEIQIFTYSYKKYFMIKLTGSHEVSTGDFIVRQILLKIL